MLFPGRVDGEGRGVDGGDRLQRDQVDAATGGEAVDVGNADGVAGVAAPGNQQQVGLRAPAVLGASTQRFGRVPQRLQPGVRAPVADAAGVVVAIVGGGSLVDLAIGADANLNALPVVLVESLLSGDRDAAKGGRVRVVGPVL
jgi:hypothetical protein